MKTILFILAFAASALAQSSINHPDKYAWGANIGWLNWRDADSAAQGAVTGEFVCSGFVWGANVGWIFLGDGTPQDGIQYSNTDGADSGVNHDGAGALRGLAWGANIGWINFEPTGNPRVNLATGRLGGFAWSANCGWINLGDDLTFFVKTDTFPSGPDSDGDGIPDAFELLHAGNLTTLTNTTDSDGDGQSDHAEYLADTDPTSGADRFQAALSAPTTSDFSITFVSQPSRLYRVETSLNLLPPWADVGLGWFFGSPSGGVTSVNLGNPPESARFYRVAVKRPLDP